MSNSGRRKRRPLNLVLLGESGSGKSASGNTILGMKAFTSEPSSTPVTTKCYTQTKSICGTEVTVIDTPEFFDDSLQMQSTHIQKCRELCKGGPCVYLLVIQIGRFTEGERDILERLEEALQTKVRDRAIILFTHGDDLVNGYYIDEYIKNTNPFLQKLIKNCGQRYQVFNNNTTSFFQQVVENFANIYIWLSGVLQCLRNPLGSNTTTHKREAENPVKELMGKISDLLQMTDRVEVFPEHDAERSRCVIA